VIIFFHAKFAEAQRTNTTNLASLRLGVIIIFSRKVRKVAKISLKFLPFQSLDKTGFAMEKKSSKTIITLVLGVILLAMAGYVIFKFWVAILTLMIGFGFGFYFGYTRGKGKKKTE
jgi:hypothetical protein